MKRFNKKGFTIVELVIVIAVIAILAGVMIPTFSGMVAKANESAAMQEANQIRTDDLILFDAQPTQAKQYVLTTDATFASNKVYYTVADGVYSKATVTAGEAVTANTYYEKTCQGTFEFDADGNVTKYTVVLDKYTVVYENDEWQKPIKNAQAS